MDTLTRGLQATTETGPYRSPSCPTGSRRSACAKPNSMIYYFKFPYHRGTAPPFRSSSPPPMCDIPHVGHRRARERIGSSLVGVLAAGRLIGAAADSRQRGQGASRRAFIGGHRADHDPARAPHRTRCDHHARFGGALHPPNLRGFQEPYEWGRKTGIGYFVTEAQLRDANEWRLVGRLTQHTDIHGPATNDEIACPDAFVDRIRGGAPVKMRVLHAPTILRPEPHQRR